MRALMVVGVLLIVAGIAGLIFQVVPITHQEQVAKVGPLTANAERQDNVFIPPYVGIVAILAGGALVFAGRRRG